MVSDRGVHSVGVDNKVLINLSIIMPSHCLYIRYSCGGTSPTINNTSVVLCVRVVAGWMCACEWVGETECVTESMSLCVSAWECVQEMSVELKFDLSIPFLEKVSFFTAKYHILNLLTVCKNIIDFKGKFDFPSDILFA